MVANHGTTARVIALAQTAALGIAGMFWAYVAVSLGRWLIRDPRQFGYVLCGELALLCGGLAILWAAHLSDKYGLF